jgi:threonine synthase
LIERRQLSRWIGARMFVKYEGQQPTGSLKDRSFAVAVAKAAELKVRGAITYSSGNPGPPRSPLMPFMWGCPG